MVTPGESVDRHSLTERWLPSRGHESAAIGPRAVMECHSGLEETPQDPVDVLHLNFECEPKATLNKAPGTRHPVVLLGGNAETGLMSSSQRDFRT